MQSEYFGHSDSASFAESGEKFLGKLNRHCVWGKLALEGQRHRGFQDGLQRRKDAVHVVFDSGIGRTN